MESTFPMTTTATAATAAATTAATTTTTTTTTTMRATYQRLLTYVRPYRAAFLLAMLAMAFTAATEVAFPKLMQHLLDNGFTTHDPQLVWMIPLGIVGIFMVRAIASFCAGYLMAWIASHVVNTLRRELFARVLTLPVHQFHQQSAGAFISRLVYEVSHISESVTTALATLFRESLTLIALLLFLLYTDWKLTLVTLVVGPLIAIMLKAFSKRLRAATQQSLQSLRDLSHTIEESIVSNKVVKVFGGQAQQMEKFVQETTRFRRAQMREAIPASATTPITHIAASIAVAIITFFALSHAQMGQGSTTPGGFIAFMTAMLLLIAPLKQLTSVNTTLQRGLTAASGIFALLDTPAEADNGTQVLPQVRGEITFDHVSFQYPEVERLALEDVSFHIPAGKTVALVGVSGGGKSTIASLLPRFYHVSKGTILVDGVDIQHLALANLRHHIALVSQDIVLFNDTVAANIAYGSLQQHSREAIIEAAQAANAWDFIQQLPEGLDTVIGENGGRFSGGQRQRIAIARALLKNAPILILDEATSALDTESERQVQAALATVMQNRTTLVIAHRLSTIEHADMILVLNKGRIVESGTHAELLAAQGVYEKLVESH
jgi:subfamily B ATP-binding cassette protein MsbA